MKMTISNNRTSRLNKAVKLRRTKYDLISIPVSFKDFHLMVSKFVKKIMYTYFNIHYRW